MKRSIISINGNRSMNFLIQTVLSPKYKTYVASDVYQAMNELRKHDAIQLVLIDTDYHTSEVFDFIQHVTTSCLYQDMTVFVLASNDSWREGFKNASKVAKCFYKPFSPQEMVESIDQVLKSEKVV